MGRSKGSKTDEEDSGNVQLGISLLNKRETGWTHGGELEISCPVDVVFIGYVEFNFREEKQELLRS